MERLIEITSFVFGTAGLVIAFWYVLRTGRIIKGLFMGWGLSVICVFVVAVVFPAIMAVYSEQCSLFFPEATGVFAIILTGWLPASGVALVAGFVRYGIKRFRLHSGQSATKKRNGKNKNGGTQCQACAVRDKPSAWRK